MMIGSRYSLSDRYHAETGRVLLSGIQALVRIPMEQLRLDRAAGRRTAAFVSGYPGSPLGGFDIEMARVVQRTDLDIVHVPAVNEELGATAVMGSQLASLRPDLRYDGVIGVWYGKAPGLDRATDALRHATFAGSSAGGGAIALVGDDPACKSSTMPSSSDAGLVDLHMPILYPGTVAECLELGLHGIAMSRVTGLWSALKVVAPIADATETVELPVLQAAPVNPELEVGEAIWTPHPSAQFLGARMIAVEEEFHEIRERLAHEYGVLNGLNRVTVDPADAWIGCIATGYTYYELREAFRRLGLADDHALERAGIRLLYLKMPVPFHEGQIADFARGLDEILVVEEKNPTLERLVRDALYPTALRPLVVGKHDPDGARIMPSHGLLDADAILPGLRTRLQNRLGDRLAPLRASREQLAVTGGRTPFFCSGCPHNWGTKVPAGATVGMGTGCHGMTLLMGEDRVGESIGITAMGNEGAQWLGMAPFVDTRHVFQNLGDGTFFHSGQLAIQAAIGAKATMTFKILYNGTVAMTGGQTASHTVGVADLARILVGHGVAQVAITTEDVGRYKGTSLPASVSVYDRSRIVEIQERLAAIDGVTVLIHDQACAAELRRGRKRKAIPTPDFRVVINHRICEGCGDCGDVSNCLSVQPVDTHLGRKTRIDQDSCNFDASCLSGDCPAFMTVKTEPGGSTRAAPPSFDELAVGDPPEWMESTAVIRLAGIGGTGVVTAAQVIGTAAMLDGWDVDGLDQTGLSQKAGPVVSDLTLTRDRAKDRAKLVGEAQAHTLLAFDQLVAVSPATIAACSPERTVTVASTGVTPVGAEISHPEMSHLSAGELEARLRAATAPGSYIGVDAAEHARLLGGLETAANLFVVGVAVQIGAVPVSPLRVREAIELNGVAVAANVAAFEWGRRWAEQPAQVDSVMAAASIDPTRVTTEPLPRSLSLRLDDLLAGPDGADPGITDELTGIRNELTGIRNELTGIRNERTGIRDLLAMLASDLVSYQDAGYAGRFVDLVEAAAVAERRATGQVGRLTATVARGFHKLLAYKDEYEVARLMLSDDGLAAVRAAGGAPERVTWHLHPPALRAAGMRNKIGFGPWSRPLFVVLARSKRLRGTRLDPFGRTEIRRLERQLPAEYAAAVRQVAGRLTADNIDEAVALADLPEMVRGFESLKLRRAAEYRARLAGALAGFDTSPARPVAAS
jgi:indolepyruvate ferredoxin oxidoreductase